MKLNLGCCDNLLPEFLNVDIFDFGRVGFEFLQADLSKPWPWEDSSVDHIRAHDIFEHILHPTGKRWPMNEAWRVLRPGGILSLIVPTTDGRGAFQDPTHVTWWTPNDMFYFCDHWLEWKRFRAAYGIQAHFRIVPARTDEEAARILNSVHLSRANNVTKLEIVLEAIK